MLQLIEASGRQDRTLLTAGEDSIMRTLRQALAGSAVQPALGASVADILTVVRSAVAGEAPDTDSMALQIPREFGGGQLVTPELIKHCHAHGIQVHVWTVNEPAEILALLEMGVDGIVTDYPDRMADLLL